MAEVDLGVLADVLSGRRRVHALPTVLIALLVTVAVAIPFVQRVRNVEESAPPASDPATVVVDLDSGPVPLQDAVLSGSARVHVSDPTRDAVSFQLFPTGSTEAILAAQDLTGPDFDLVSSGPLDTTLLPDGKYELFLTTSGKSGEQRTAVSFEVFNG